MIFGSKRGHKATNKTNTSAGYQMLDPDNHSLMMYRNLNREYWVMQIAQWELEVYVKQVTEEPYVPLNFNEPERIRSHA